VHRPWSVVLACNGNSIEFFCITQYKCCPKNTISLIFYLYFFGFIYKLFSTSFFTTSSTTLWCPSSSSAYTIASSIRLANFLMLIKSHRISFIIIWNIIGEFIKPKNITVGSKNFSSVMNIAFHSSFFFIHTLL